MIAIKNILHPTDFSMLSDYAFQLACALASDYSANLTIMHVVKPALVLSEGVVFASTETDEEELHQMLQDLQVPDERVDVIRRLEEGNPAREILRMAELIHADLIVMGTHARTGLTRLLLGSVSEQVVRNAHCPVLTVTTPIPLEEPSVVNGRECAVVT